MASSPLPTLADFKPEAWRGSRDRFRIGLTREGVWWWVTPTDEPGFICGVEGVRPVPGQPAGQALLGQLAGWGFNLLGPASAPPFTGHGLAHLISLELRGAESTRIRVGGAHLPDVFDAGWAAMCASRVAAVNAGSGLAGYLSDRELGWAQPSAAVAAPSRPTLLQLCLGLDPRHAAYHAAWEFVLAPRGGELAALNGAWGVALRNKEALRQMTLAEEPLTTPGYLVDHARFTREFAQRYFRTAAAAVRQADPGRLFFGAPVSVALPEEIREAAAAQVDVFVTDAAPATASGGPVLVSGFNWTAFADEPASADDAGLSRLELMHRRGRAALQALAAHPRVIGYEWGAHVHGDRATEAPFASGLLYEDGSVAHEHVQPLAAINRQVVRWHAGAAGPVSASSAAPWADPPPRPTD